MRSADSLIGETMNTQGNDLAALRLRVDELEIKCSFSDDLLDGLNTLVARQAEQIDAMAREILRLKDRLERSIPTGGTELSDPADERPPHY